MECYNLYCEERDDCHRYKRAICLKRRTKEQVEVLNQIHGRICNKCFSTMIKARAKYSKSNINVCTNCKEVEFIEENYIEKKVV